MERFTKSNFKYEKYPETEHSSYRVKDYNKFATVYNHLAILEDKIESGELISNEFAKVKTLYKISKSPTHGCIDCKYYNVDCRGKDCPPRYRWAVDKIEVSDIKKYIEWDSEAKKFKITANYFVDKDDAKNFARQLNGD